MADEELIKWTGYLYRDDLELLKVTYPALGPSKIIRGLLRQHVRKLNDRTAEKLEEVSHA